jgi:hypothetical protein
VQQHRRMTNGQRCAHMQKAAQQSTEVPNITKHKSAACCAHHEHEQDVCMLVREGAKHVQVDQP